MTEQKAENAPQAQQQDAQQDGQQPQGQQPQGQQPPNGSSSQALATDGQAQQGQQTLQRRDQGALASANSPFTLMRRMMDDMDYLSEAFGFPSPRRLGLPSFFDLAPRALSEMQQAQQALWSPQVEVFEREGQIVVRADLPGLSKEDVQIQVEDDVLTLRGERKSEHEERQKGFYRSERSYGTFQRSFRLPEGVDSEQVQANFKDGVLEITVPAPKPQEKQSRQVQIQ